jgi:acyl-CoA synthetase (NDP forming)
MIDNNFNQSFFNPHSVAIVGASSNAQKTGARVQRFLVSHGYKGKIYPVNPNREEIFGLKCYPKLTKIHKQIDHVFIAVDGNKIIDAVRDAVSMNIKCATILSGGFSESGSEGLNLEKQILHIAREGNLRILGPNSIGIINISDSVVLSANAMLDLPNLKKGGLSVISQSGSLIGALLAHGHSRGIGFSKLFSVGNESDLTVGEIGKMLICDDDTHTIILFLETLRNSKEVSEMARLAYASGKSVITYKLGKSDLGKELAKSHTGAIAGSDDAFNAFIKYNGIKRVHIFESLIEVPNLFKNKKLPEGNRIGIVTTTGGGGAMVVESLSSTDIEVIDPELLISKLIDRHNIPLNKNKVVDLTIAGTKPKIVSDAIKYFMDDNDCDLVVMVVGSSAKFRPDQAVEPLVKFGKYKKPLAVYIAPEAPEALKVLQQHDIACFRTPESCAEGIRAYLNTKAPKKNIEKSYNFEGISDKLKGYPHKNLSEKNSLEIFKEIGINTVHFEIFSNEEQAKHFASILGFPVAIKILSNDFLHKTEISGVELNINSMESLISSYQKLSKISNDLNIKENEKKFLMQKMEKGLTEIILGYRIDELVGPIVMIGSGGVMSEIFDDKSIRIAPVEMSDAMEMIKEVKSLISVQGFRGLPKGDMKVLAQAIVQISQLASVREIKDAEINPIIIKEGQEGLVAVDGLITLN